jgi:hypothetical protein
MNKTALFPKAYYTQEKFAESYLYEFLTEEYEIGVGKMQFIKTATASINGATQKYFIYKIMNSDEDSKVWQLAFCGPFVNNSAVAEIDIEAQDIFLDDEDFNAAKIDSRFKKFIADKSPATGLPKK